MPEMIFNTPEGFDGFRNEQEYEISINNKTALRQIALEAAMDIPSPARSAADIVADAKVFLDFLSPPENAMVPTQTSIV